MSEPAVPRELNPVYHELAILDRYVVDPETDCWEWAGQVDKTHGYGRCKVENKTVVAHRVFYEHHIGPIPKGLELDHLCRNRRCVNPVHLEAVTRAVNVRRGVHTKLTQEDVNVIRSILDTLCAHFGVRPRTLAAIAERKIWKPGTEEGGGDSS